MIQHGAEPIDAVFVVLCAFFRPL